MKPEDIEKIFNDNADEHYHRYGIDGSSDVEKLNALPNDAISRNAFISTVQSIIAPLEQKIKAQAEELVLWSVRIDELGRINTNYCKTIDGLKDELTQAQQTIAQKDADIATLKAMCPPHYLTELTEDDYRAAMDKMIVHTTEGTPIGKYDRFKQAVQELVHWHQMRADTAEWYADALGEAWEKELTQAKEEIARLKRLCNLLNGTPDPYEGEIKTYTLKDIDKMGNQEFKPPQSAESEKG